ncbi:hypothetical protein Plhal304r1_c083g0168031 [Plasmopara halstedii]
MAQTYKQVDNIIRAISASDVDAVAVVSLWCLAQYLLAIVFNLFYTLEKRFVALASCDPICASDRG